MPAVDPYAEEEKRRAQVGMLRDQPVSTTMPVGERAPLPTEQGRPSWHVDPTTDMGTLQGFDARNMADPEMQSVKYRHGRLARGVTKPSEMAALVQSEAYQRAFPGATFDGKDRVNFMGTLSDGDRGTPVEVMDVLRAANRDTDSSEGGWWGDISDVVADPSAAPSGKSPLVADDSAFSRIMAELNAASNGEMSPAEREAMLQMLQGI